MQGLIRKTACENAGWGSPRIHAELTKLGFAVSQSTVSRYMPTRPSPEGAAKRWRVFLRNHASGIAAMDFFTMPTASFRVLYVWFVIRHERRDIVHFSVTDRPNAAWVAQQLREAFPYDEAPDYLIFDGDPTFRDEVGPVLASFGIGAKRTAPASPWQNGIAERWIGSCRRELLDHVIAFDEAHLARLLRAYVDYYRQDRLHLSLGKNAPIPRAAASRPTPESTVIALPRVGGLHHRYEWRPAA